MPAIFWRVQASSAPSSDRTAAARRPESAFADIRGVICMTPQHPARSIRTGCTRLIGALNLPLKTFRPAVSRRISLKHYRLMPTNRLVPVIGQRRVISRAMGSFGFGPSNSHRAVKTIGDIR
jgi:hypothetical protein